MSKIEAALEPLRELYGITGVDWSLRVDIVLTEPTCPRAVIHPEGWDISHYECYGYGNSIEHAIISAANMVYREVILREQLTDMECPLEGDDKLYAEWVKARIRGNDAKLPVRNCGSPSGEF